MRITTFQRNKGVYSNIWKIYIFKFLSSLFFISPVLVPFFTNWGGLSFFQIMILQSWFMLWSFILEIPTGAIADRIGRRNTLIIGAFFGIVWVLVYSSYPSFYVFLLGEFFAAVAVALVSGAEEAFVYDSLKKTGRENQSKYRQPDCRRIWSQGATFCNGRPIWNCFHFGIYIQGIRQSSKIKQLRWDMSKTTSHRLVEF